MCVFFFELGGDGSLRPSEEVIRIGPGRGKNHIRDAATSDPGSSMSYRTGYAALVSKRGSHEMRDYRRDVVRLPTFQGIVSSHIKWNKCEYGDFQ